MSFNPFVKKILDHTANGATIKAACQAEGIERTKAYRILNLSVKARGLETVGDLVRQYQWTKCAR